MQQAIYLISAHDRKGLLTWISGFFTQEDFNILDCRHYTAEMEGRYFMRIRIDLDSHIGFPPRELEKRFSKLAKELSLQYSVHYSDEKPRMAIMVSKTSHCLYDLLSQQEEGALDCEIPLIVSNHETLRYVAERFNIPYFCVEAKSKAEQEAEFLKLFAEHRVDFVVMARYMQILTDEFIAHYPMKIINIHHAFLPAFQGGDPYTRAWARGVKMIGATAHYATAELDEGPIIEQDVERISHEHSPDDLRAIGRDIERRVLTRAVRAHLEHRVLISGRRTIVFSM